MSAPRLDTVLHAPVEVDALLRRVPSRRDRLVLAWPGAAGVAGAWVRAARAAGWARIRLCVALDDLAPEALEAAVAAGVDELELLAVPRGCGPARSTAAPWPAIARLRAAGALKLVVATVPVPDGDPATLPDPAACDEWRFDATGAPDGAGAAATVASWIDARDRVGGRPRRLSFAGLPICRVRKEGETLRHRADPDAAGDAPFLAAGEVVSNALAADLPPGTLRLKAEASDRAYFPACRDCALFLACDGLPSAAFRDPGGRAATVGLRAFGELRASGAEVTPRGLSARVHPPTFLSGKVHVLSVLAGSRPCGRIVVGTDDARRQAARLERLGLRVAIVGAPDAPSDLDAGATRDAPSAVHLFFSRDDAADRAADLERRFAAAEAGADPMGADVFARAIGALLGYPACCIEAFVAAGPLATTSDLVRAAHGRSDRFDARLDVLDPLSPFPLVPHVPCRFDCAPSAALAARVLAALPALFPFLDGAAGVALGRPALFLDTTRCVRLDGVADPDGRGARYTLADATACRPGAPRDRAVAAFLDVVVPALVQGDHVRVEGPRLEVRRADTVVLARDLEVEPLLFPFGW